MKVIQILTNVFLSEQEADLLTSNHTDNFPKHLKIFKATIQEINAYNDLAAFFQGKLPESSITLSFSDIVNLPEKTVSKVGKLIGTHFEIKNIPLFKYSVESEFANFFKSYLKNSRVYKEPQSHTISI